MSHFAGRCPCWQVPFAWPRRWPCLRCGRARQKRPCPAAPCAAGPPVSRRCGPWAQEGSTYAFAFSAAENSLYHTVNALQGQGSLVARLDFAALPGACFVQRAGLCAQQRRLPGILFRLRHGLRAGRCGFLRQFQPRGGRQHPLQLVHAARARAGWQRRARGGAGEFFRVGRALCGLRHPAVPRLCRRTAHDRPCQRPGDHPVRAVFPRSQRPSSPPARMLANCRTAALCSSSAPRRSACVCAMDARGRLEELCRLPGQAVGMGCFAQSDYYYSDAGTGSLYALNTPYGRGAPLFRCAVRAGGPGRVRRQPAAHGGRPRVTVMLHGSEEALCRASPVCPSPCPAASRQK